MTMIATIPTDAVIRTYRGRTGCACGCRGTYSSNTRAIRSRTRFVNDHLDRATISRTTVPNDSPNPTEVLVIGCDIDGTLVILYVDAARFDALT